MKKPYTLEQFPHNWRSFVPNPYTQIGFTRFGWQVYKKYATIKQAKDGLRTLTIASRCRRYKMLNHTIYLMGKSYRILLPDETYLYYKDGNFIHIH